MRVAYIPYPLNSDNMFAVDADKRRQTRIYTRVVYFSRRGVELRDYDGAGAAAAFGAPEFCARKADAAEVFEEGDFGVGGGEGYGGAVEVEAEGGGVG